MTKRQRNIDMEELREKNNAKARAIQNMRFLGAALAVLVVCYYPSFWSILIVAFFLQFDGIEGDSL